MPPAEIKDLPDLPFNQDFGVALANLNIGNRMCRAGWNGKAMWLTLVKTWSGSTGNMPSDWGGFSPFIAMYTADKKLVPWLASQTDILAEDWGFAA